MSKLNWSLLAILGLMVLFIGIRPQQERTDPFADIPSANEVLARYFTPEPVPSQPVEDKMPPVDMVEFLDPLVGFEARVPIGWYRQVISSQSVAGYTISFESPPADDTDVFSDYLVVEILPGGVPVGLGNAVIDERVEMVVQGRTVSRERALLSQYPVAGDTLDLVAWQVRVVDESLSIGIYVVGEQQAAPRLERLLIEFAHSFKLFVSPFVLS